MSARVAKQGLAFQPVTWLTTARAASSSGLSVATSRVSPSNDNPTTMCLRATSAGITPSTSGDTGVVVGSQKGRFNWSATAATRSRSLTSPSVERIFARGTPVSDSLDNAYSRASLERTLRFTRNSPTLREAVCITVLSARLQMTLIDVVPFGKIAELDGRLSSLLSLQEARTPRWPRPTPPR